MNAKKKVALISDSDSLSVDYDMPLITDAFKNTDVQADVVFWDESNPDWSMYDAVVLRSPWTYMEKIQPFIEFCQNIEKNSVLLNPVSVIEWNSNKNYLKQLEAQGIPIVPTEIIYSVTEIHHALDRIQKCDWDVKEVVIKPTIGAYSFGVVRLSVKDIDKIRKHVTYLLELDKGVIVQPYLHTIEEHGETNMIYFNNTYSHAIKKEALLSQHGETKTPDMEYRKIKEASDEEKALAIRILNLVQSSLGLNEPLLYARLDFIEDKNGQPLLLELEITEPSLSLPLTPKCTHMFVQSIINRTPSLEYD
ncbi:RimK family alpha-L-glutamate ligase [Vibrio cyclitrophicus]